MQGSKARRGSTLTHHSASDPGTTSSDRRGDLWNVDAVRPRVKERIQHGGEHGDGRQQTPPVVRLRLPPREQCTLASGPRWRRFMWRSLSAISCCTRAIRRGQRRATTAPGTRCCWTPPARPSKPCTSCRALLQWTLDPRGSCTSCPPTCPTMRVRCPALLYSVRRLERELSVETLTWARGGSDHAGQYERLGVSMVGKFLYPLAPLRAPLTRSPRV